MVAAAYIQNVRRFVLFWRPRFRTEPGDWIRPR